MLDHNYLYKRMVQAITPIQVTASPPLFLAALASANAIYDSYVDSYLSEHTKRV